MEAVFTTKEGVLRVTVGDDAIQFNQEWFELLQNAENDPAAMLCLRAEIAPQMSKEPKKLLFKHAVEIVRAARDG